MLAPMPADLIEYTKLAGRFGHDKGEIMENPLPPQLKHSILRAHGLCLKALLQENQH